MILIDFGWEDVVHFLFDGFHFSEDVLGELVLAGVNVCFAINLSLNIHHPLLNLLIQRLHIQLTIIQSLVNRQLLSLILILNLLHSLVNIRNIYLQIIILLPLMLYLILDRLPSPIFEQINFILKLFNCIF